MFGRRLVVLAAAIAVILTGVAQPSDACPTGQQRDHRCCQSRQLASAEKTCCEAPRPTPETDAACQCVHPQEAPDAVINQLPSDTDHSDGSDIRTRIDQPIEPRPGCGQARTGLLADDRPPPIFLLACAFLI
jgi:hypothetical protein